MPRPSDWDEPSTLPQPGLSGVGTEPSREVTAPSTQATSQLLHFLVPSCPYVSLNDLGKFLTSRFNWAIGPVSLPQHNCSGPFNKGTVSVAR